MQSRFADKQGVGTPQPPTPIKLTLAPRPERKSASSNRPTRAATPKATPTSPVKHVRIKSAPVRLTPKPPTPKPPTPMKAWSMSIPETKFTPIPQPFSPDSELFDTGSVKPERIQSATVRRERTTPPKRPVKSAGPVRSPSTSSSQTAAVPRPRAPAPPRESRVSGFRAAYSFTSESEPAVDYDEQLDRFGWRMQVHGDPLNMK